MFVHSRNSEYFHLKIPRPIGPDNYFSYNAPCPKMFNFLSKFRSKIAPKKLRQSWTKNLGTPRAPVQCWLLNCCSKGTFASVAQHWKGARGFMLSSYLKFSIILATYDKVSQQFCPRLSENFEGFEACAGHRKNRKFETS